jgi:hypothetical protein
LAVQVLFFSTGCQVQPQRNGLYTGPTESLDEVVSQIDANNQQIPTLWARQEFDGTIVDDKGESHALSAHGVILYRGPHELRIVASKEFVGPVFEIGATDASYWLKVNLEQVDTMWWGRMANAGKPCVADMPIRPDLVLAVLGVGLIDKDFNREPYPLMRFNNDADAYMVDTVVKTADRMLVQKEVWYDRQTLLPGLVLLYDENGRVVMQAQLTDFQALALDGVPKEKWPKIATTYTMRFPATGSKLKFTLSDMALTNNGLPREGTIHLPDLGNPGVKRVIQVDAACDISAPRAKN